MVWECLSQRDLIDDRLLLVCLLTSPRNAPPATVLSFAARLLLVAEIKHDLHLSEVGLWVASLRLF